MTFAILALICSVGVVLFTFLSTRAKDIETQKSEKELKSSVNEVQKNLDESLIHTNNLISEINTMGESLMIVKKNLNKQISILENSLDEAKRFQKMLDEQNLIDRKRFESEGARLVFSNTDTVWEEDINHPDHYVFKQKIKNTGHRHGIIKRLMTMLLLTDENYNVSKQLFASESELNGLISPDTGVFIHYSKELFKKEDIKNVKGYIIYVVQVEYQDEASNMPISLLDVFQYAGFKDSGLMFSMLEENKKPKFYQYFANIFQNP
ncbi:hypothetical protein [Winogradskyella sp.]|uniref:hypothetical protein n=1 Tax=Winogradskyella sp. TaxID=1883156 RepID=UPI003BA895B0